MRFLLPTLTLCFAMNGTAAAQSISAEEMSRRQATVKGVEVFVKRFVKHGSNLKVETIVDCSITSQLIAVSGLKEHKKGNIDDTMLLKMSAEQRAWSALYNKKKESGANMNVGEAKEFFKPTDGKINKDKASKYFISKTKSCTQAVEKIQKNGLLAEAGGAR